ASRSRNVRSSWLRTARTMLSISVSVAFSLLRKRRSVSAMIARRVLSIQRATNERCLPYAIASWSIDRPSRVADGFTGVPRRMESAISTLESAVREAEAAGSRLDVLWARYARARVLLRIGHPNGRAEMRNRASGFCDGRGRHRSPRACRAELKL